MGRRTEGEEQRCRPLRLRGRPQDADRGRLWPRRRSAGRRGTPDTGGGNPAALPVGRLPGRYRSRRDRHDRRDEGGIPRHRLDRRLPLPPARKLAPRVHLSVSLPAVLPLHPVAAPLPVADLRQPRMVERGRGLGRVRRRWRRGVRRWRRGGRVFRRGGGLWGGGGPRGGGGVGGGGGGGVGGGGGGGRLLRRGRVLRGRWLLGELVKHAPLLLEARLGSDPSARPGRGEEERPRDARPPP